MIRLDRARMDTPLELLGWDRVKACRLVTELEERWQRYTNPSVLDMHHTINFTPGLFPLLSIGRYKCWGYSGNNDVGDGSLRTSTLCSVCLANN